MICPQVSHYNGAMKEHANRLAIIGGGAAGLAAAVAAGERARRAGSPLDVVVFERDDRVGRSILATGNGRCNFSNVHPYVDDYHNGAFVEEAFRGLAFAYRSQASEREMKQVFNNGDVVHAFFYQHGLMWREEDDGRQYPKTNKASTVVDILRVSAANVGAREACESTVRAVEAPRGQGKPFTLRMDDGVLERADAVIVACGGRALGALDACSLSVRTQKPVLGPLRVADSDMPIVRELDNIRIRCQVALVRQTAKSGKLANAERPDGPGYAGRIVARETGELMFRKYGVSGICVFNLSRIARPGDELRVNFLDGARLCDARDYLFGRRKLLAGRFPKVTCFDMLRGLVLPRVGEAVLGQAGLASERIFDKSCVDVLARALIGFRLEVAGIGDASLCQVMRGGLDVKAFDPRTMEARDCAGLYAAGEALDVDGPCGGYNLHWAWASGLLAGMSAADALLGGRDVEPDAGWRAGGSR